MNITVLDASGLGADIDLSPLHDLGNTAVYQTTAPNEVAERIQNADVVISNKVKLGKNNMADAQNIKLVCELATGYDNIDTVYCASRGIAVSNVRGYSTDCVAQVAVSMALSLVTHLPRYNKLVTGGEYTNGGRTSLCSPVFHEISGMTWGIIGLGTIGKRVAKIAEALGCRVIGCRRKNTDSDFELADLDTLLANSDIISVHLPLSDETKNLISAEKVDKIKRGAVFINVARGAVADEAALAEAVSCGRLGGLGIDVFSSEPLPPNHPIYQIRNLENVCLTPHMAWCGFETRTRCLNETILNIKAFFSGEERNRIV